MDNIRNFAIIAHIDHGKSTLADRFLEETHVIEKGHHNEQMLDRNPISRERGITIKLAPVRMMYKMTNDKSQITNETQSSNNQNLKKLETSNSEYILNLIDTPGHVDFSYEVDRTLSCVEGVILLVDATQGIQAQTIANAYKALEKNLVILPAINKIDLPNAEVAKTKKQLVDFLGVKDEEIFEISAKTGIGTSELLRAVVEKIPGPKTNSVKQFLSHESLTSPSAGPLESEKIAITSLHSVTQTCQALIFDSYYDSHRGVIAFVRVFNGTLKRGLRAKLASGNLDFEVMEVGYFSPDLKKTDNLENGQIGYVVTNLKDIHEVRVGDTIIDQKSTTPPLPGYKSVKPMVYASVFPTLTADYLNLKKALEKLYLNDSALQFVNIHSQALGAGFRVGFLGLLHADVVRERLEREFELSLVLTPPQVEYKKKNNKFEEPYVKVMIVTPQEHVGSVMTLLQSYRAKFITMDNINQTILTYEMPMSEMISDFFDNLKSVTSGFASLDWEFLKYVSVDADKLVLLLNNEPVEEFSEIVVAERAYEKASFLTSKLKDLIPRQQYDVKIQGQYKGKIIASSRISPFRKNVLIKSGKVLGTGDVGRKKMLLEKQKEGKKKMKMIGRVEIPKEAFLKLFNKK